jgi:hypothetical protein
MPMSDVPTYSDRIARRLEVWWQKPRNYRHPATYTDFLHQLRERNTFRDRFDAEERWRCCAHWQRSLSNKWNAREFALRHGCRVPALYWYGREIVWGREIGVDAMHRRLGGTARSFGRGRILVEEFVGRRSGTSEMPLECKLFMFGDQVGAIEVFRRSHRRIAPESYVDGLGLIEHRCYSAAWEPFEDRFFTADYVRKSYGNVPSSEPSSPPGFLQELIAAGRKLGSAYGTHARIDFLVGEKGVFFNEFGTTPSAAALTPFADEYLGLLWQETSPDET